MYPTEHILDNMTDLELNNYIDYLWIKTNKVPTLDEKDPYKIFFQIMKRGLRQTLEPQVKKWIDEKKINSPTEDIMKDRAALALYLFEPQNKNIRKKLYLPPQMVKTYIDKFNLLHTTTIKMMILDLACILDTDIRNFEKIDKEEIMNLWFKIQTC